LNVSASTATFDARLLVEAGMKISQIRLDAIRAALFHGALVRRRRAGAVSI
jgi:hypothetical protein